MVISITKDFIRVGDKVKAYKTNTTKLKFEEIITVVINACQVALGAEINSIIRYKAIYIRLHCLGYFGKMRLTSCTMNVATKVGDDLT